VGAARVGCDGGGGCKNLGRRRWGGKRNEGGGGVG
jgi:hypothetical protein